MFEIIGRDAEGRCCRTRALEVLQETRLSTDHTVMQAGGWLPRRLLATTRRPDDNSIAAITAID